MEKMRYTPPANAENRPVWKPRRSMSDREIAMLLAPLLIVTALLFAKYGTGPHSNSETSEAPAQSHPVLIVPNSSPVPQE